MNERCIDMLGKAAFLNHSVADGCFVDEKSRRKRWVLFQTGVEIGIR
jgi:hypothetical protein